MLPLFSRAIPRSCLAWLAHWQVSGAVFFGPDDTSGGACPTRMCAACIELQVVMTQLVVWEALESVRDHLAHEVWQRFMPRKQQ
jgi:hypothetical protein